MREPVQTDDGHVYDYKWISRWFNTGKKTSPVTGLVLPSRKLLPLTGLKRAIEEYIETCQQFAQKELDRREKELEGYRKGIVGGISETQRRVKIADTYVLQGYPHLLLLPLM